MDKVEDPTLVLLPGLDGTGLLFEPFLERLPADAKIKLVSYPADVVLNLDQLADYVRDNLPAEGTFMLLAESFSGPVAVRLLEHPRLSGVILCASFLRSPRPFLLSLAKLPISFVFRLPLPRSILRLFCLEATSSDALVDLSRRALSKVRPKVLLSRFRILAELDELTRIAGPVPVCYLRPTEDKLVSLRSVNEIRKHRPSLTVYELTAPHFLLQARPAESYDVISRFREEIRACTLSRTVSSD